MQVEKAQHFMASKSTYNASKVASQRVAPLYDPSSQHNVHQSMLIDYQGSAAKETFDFYEYFADVAPAPQARSKHIALSSLINPLITTLTKSTTKLYTYDETEDLT